jgi:Mce-associated membrane protein
MQADTGRNGHGPDLRARSVAVAPDGADEIVKSVRESAHTATESAVAAAAEAEAAAAEARAVAAHARAIQLRRLADLATSNPEAASSPAVSDTNRDELAQTSGTPPAPSRRRWWARVRRHLVVGGAGAVICALLAASAYLSWHHHGVMQNRARAAEFAAAARQGVVNMTSLDFGKANDDVSRILSSSTGAFKDDFERHAADFTSVVEQSKVVTKGAVNATAVESMTDDSAVVLVSATSTVTNAAGAKAEPRSWRLIVTVSRDAGQLKMSKVEFVP